MSTFPPFETSGTNAPVMVPFTVVPFFNSIVTVSLLSFICRRPRDFGVSTEGAGQTMSGDCQTHQEPIRERPAKRKGSNSRRGDEPGSAS